VLTKTSLMLGLGETDAEIAQCMDDLRAAGVDMLTLGQYLRPTVNHLPVERFVDPRAVRAVSRVGARARISRVRRRSAGALELSRRAGACGQQRGPRRCAPARHPVAAVSDAARAWRPASAGSAVRLRADLARDAAFHR
jgi:lipoyl synthase